MGTRDRGFKATERITSKLYNDTSKNKKTMAIHKKMMLLFGCTLGSFLDFLVLDLSYTEGLKLGNEI